MIHPNRTERLSLTEAAADLKVSKSTLKRLIGDGELAVLSIGRKRWIERGTLDDYLEARRAEADEQRALRARGYIKHNNGGGKPSASAR